MAAIDYSKRNVSRFLAGLSADIRYLGQDYPCEALNLSREGMLLVGQCSPEVNQTLSLSLRTTAGDLDLQASCLVHRVEQDEDSTRLGLSFQNLNDSQQATLKAILSRVIEGQMPAPLAALPVDARPKQITQALEKVALAHRVALARRADSHERGYLLLDSNPQVLEALARNKKTNLNEVFILARMPHLFPSTIEILARDPRWKTNDELQILLAGHSRVSYLVAESILPRLDKTARDKLLRKPGLNPAIRLKLLRFMKKK
jgi:hypothetical protein